MKKIDIENKFYHSQTLKEFNKQHGLEIEVRKLVAKFYVLGDLKIDALPCQILK